MALRLHGHGMVSQISIVHNRSTANSTAKRRTPPRDKFVRAIKQVSKLTDVDKKKVMQETRQEVTLPCICIHMSFGTDILRATHGKETFVPPLGSRYFLHDFL
jgi:hypothetical protein